MPLYADKCVLEPPCGTYEPASCVLYVPTAQSSSPLAGRDCTYATRVPGPGVTMSRGTTGAAACSARRAWRRTGCSSTTLALALALARAGRARTLTLTRILTGTLTLALALTTHYTRPHPHPDQVRPSPRGLPGRQLPTAADERRHVPRRAASASARRHQLPRRRRRRRRATHRLRAGLRVRRRVRAGRGARRFAASPSP